MRSLISDLLSRTEKKIEAERMRCSYHLTGASKCSVQHMCHKLTAVACSANNGLLLRHAGSSVTEPKREAMATSDQKKILKHTQPGRRGGGVYLEAVPS